MRQQADYYRAARERVRRLEERFAIDDEARLDTTTKLGGRDRLFSVKQLVNLLTASVAVADLAAAYYVLFVR